MERKDLRWRAPFPEGAKIVFQTVHAGSDFIPAALATGALEYVSKLRINSDLLFALEVPPAGRILVCPLISAV